MISLGFVVILIEIAVNTWFPNEKDYYKGHVVLLWDYYIKSPKIESLVESPGNGYDMKLSDTGILALSEVSLKAILRTSFQFIKAILNDLFSSAVYPDQKSGLLEFNDFHDLYSFLPWELEVKKWIRNSYEAQQISKTPLVHQWEDLSFKYNSLYDELKSLDIRTGLKKLLNITEPDIMRYDLMDWDSYGEQQFLDPDSSIERMKRKIDNYQSKWDMEEYESPSLAIIDGSLMGKTRHVLEIGKERFLFFICFRNVYASGWPLRSFVADRFFDLKLMQGLGLESWLKPEGAVSHYLCTLALLIGCIKYLKERLIQSKWTLTCEEWIKEQLKNGENGKNGNGSSCKRKVCGTEFWQKVIVLVSKELVELSKATAIGVFDFSLSARYVRDKCIADFKDCIPQNHWLNQTMKEKREAIILFAFDEGISLFEDVPNRKVDYYDILKTSLASFPSSSGVFALFLDTQAALAKYLRETDVLINTSSFRRQSRGEQRFPPYWDICTWDAQALHLEKVMESIIELSLKFSSTAQQRVPFSVSSSSSLNQDTILQQLISAHVSFGRPVWFLMKDPHDRLHFAYQKMIGGLASAKDTLNEAQYMAIATCRIALTVAPSSELASTLVKSFCSINCGISEDNRRIFSVYGADPCLMDGAAVAFNMPFFKREKLWSIIYEQIQRGIVESGYRGELIGRIIPLLAMDKAIMSCYPSGISEASMFSFARPIKVGIWLGYFLNQKSFEPILNIQAKSQSGKEALLRSLMNGLVFFKAFFYSACVVSGENLKGFYCRGLAIICKVGHAAYDLMIPVLLAESKTFTYIAIQLKNWQTSDSNYTSAWHSMTPEKSGCYPELPESPYLGIYCSFGYKKPRIVDLLYSPASPSASPIVCGAGKANQWWPMAKPKNMEAVKGAENQFLIGVLGFSNSIYPCIDDEKDSKLKDLLVASEKIWDLHARELSDVEGIASATKVLERKLSPMYQNYKKESGKLEEIEDSSPAGGKESKKRALSP